MFILNDTFKIRIFRHVNQGKGKIRIHCRRVRLYAATLCIEYETMDRCRCLAPVIEQPAVEHYISMLSIEEGLTLPLTYHMNHKPTGIAWTRHHIDMEACSIRVYEVMQLKCTVP